MTVSTPFAESFAEGGFIPVLHSFVRRLADGRLEVIGATARRTLWLEAGQLRAVGSDAEEEKLGSWLVARGLLDSSSLAVALLGQPEGVRLGTVLVQRGLVETSRVEQELLALAVAIVGKLLVEEGSYVFDPHTRLDAAAATLETTTGELVLLAARQLPDSGVLASLCPSDRFLSATRDALMKYQRVRLNAPEALVMSKVDGMRCLAELQGSVPLPEDQVRRAVVALLAAGIVEAHEQRTPAQGGSEEVDAPTRTDAGDGLQFTAQQQQEYEQVMRLGTEIAQRDYYRRMALNRGATLHQIHDRFRELSRLYHPDRSTEPHLSSARRELAEIETKLQEAYETLIDPGRRGAYDQGMRLVEPDRPLEGNGRSQHAKREVAEGNFRRAQELMRAGDVGGAIQLLDQSVRFDPRPEALLLLARLEFRNPFWTQRGLDHLRRAVTVDPHFTEAWLELASFWERKQRPDRQKQCLERILSYEPDNLTARRGLAELKRQG